MLDRQKTFKLFEDEASAAAGAPVPGPSLLEGNVWLMSLINPWLSSLKTELEVHPSLFHFLWVLVPVPLCVLTSTAWQAVF